MAGKRKQFKPYSAARTFVIALGLTSMQDWIAYAKSGTRPADIPSNPWNVYKDELAGMNPPQKFVINEFIGCKLTRKARTPKDANAPKVARVKKVKVDAPDAPVADTPDTSGMSPFEIAKTAIKVMKLPSRDAFNDVKRKNMLPAGVPKNPDSTFKDSGWNGWADFLGNVKTVVATF